MQTILGSGGAIGTELAKVLTQHTDRIRLVSRNPKAVNVNDELYSADLTQYDATLKAVEGSEIVYLMVGIPYKTKIWEKEWPIIMRNVINACKTHNAKLVFVDNVYMYDPESISSMTEETLVNPVSKKGVIRTQIAQMLLQEVADGKLQATIARSADYYGPSIKNTSMLTEVLFKPYSQGKKANWLGSLDCRHSFTYTPDAANAIALLGNSEDTYNKVWHLPTAANPLTGQEWIDTVAQKMGVEPKVQVATTFIARLIGLFVPVMKETVEMMYQYDRDYVFVSNKFESRFGITATPYLKGIEEIIKSDYRIKQPVAQAEAN